MASVTLCFEDQIGMGIEYLKQHEISVEANEIILERVIYQSGRTIYKVNGSVATRQMVKELSSLLIDVHGQHEPQSLLDIASHIRLLDSFGEKDFSQKRKLIEDVTNVGKV